MSATPPSSWPPPTGQVPVDLPPPPGAGSVTPPPFPPLPAAPFGAAATSIVRHPTVGRRQRWGAIAGVLGAAGLAAGTFLPWWRADVEGTGTRFGNGWHNVLGDMSWGPVLLVLAAVAAAGVAPALANVRSAPAAFASAGATGIAVLVVIAQTLTAFEGHPHTGVTVTYGLAVLSASALIAAVGVGLAVGSDRAAKVSDSRAVGAVG